MATTGVYPCYKNQFAVDITGGNGETESNLKTIADMESFSVSIDGNTEEWSPYDAEGWTRRTVTGKSITISVSGKRNIGDAGNEFVDKVLLTLAGNFWSLVYCYMTVRVSYDSLLNLKKT